MINAEMMENPVLEELDSSVPILDEVAGKEADRDRAENPEEPVVAKKDDPFENVDLDQYFREYLDPGYRSPESEFVEKPSFENFVSKPTTLTEHLMWQLGSLHVPPPVYRAAELVIGNLNDDGYLTATEQELMAVARGEVAVAEAAPVEAASIETAEAAGNDEPEVAADFSAASAFREQSLPAGDPSPEARGPLPTVEDGAVAVATADSLDEGVGAEPAILPHGGLSLVPKEPGPRAPFDLDDLRQAIDLVRQMDPVGVAASDLRECLLLQLEHLADLELDRKRNVNGNGHANGEMESEARVLQDAIQVVDGHLRQVQNKQFKEIARALGRPLEAVNAALELIRSLDPRPGLRYNKVEPRLIEPDVAFVKHGDEYLVMLNDEDVPQLRLSPTYKRLLNRDAADKEVRGYVKERYKSAIQLIKNIEQRKQTILKVCYAIVGRQRDFLDYGIDQLKPMMIKEVAEEIGVHPSTVSRAVANKYAHTPQGVFELRYFFSESVNGPEGGNTSLLILKRRVKKLIEDEDATRPLTDDQITRILQSQGIQVTRRTVAKYREDMGIPSTHQRRVKN
jgi:RNA polymerase sigma-54 factor